MLLKMFKCFQEFSSLIFNRNDWEAFNPYTNVLWIHYVTEKLLEKLQQKGVKIKKFSSRVLEYHSCYEILFEDDLFK